MHIQKIILALALLVVCCSIAYICKVSGKKDDFAKLLESRHSGYAFDGSKMVTHEQLASIMKAGQSAASSYNAQPWVFIVCDKATNPDAYTKALSSLVEFNQKWAAQAPVLVICVASSNSHKGEFNKWAQYDTGAAAFSMMLQATSLGLMTHQMGGFDEAKIAELFEIPEDFVPMAVMAIGYPARAETKPKTRKPLSENFFMGSWDRP